MIRPIVTCLLVLALAGAAGVAQSETFTYRGYLEDGGAPAEGRYDLQLTLYADAQGSRSLAAPIELSEVVLEEGRFTVAVPVPSLPAHTDTAWLGVAVKSAHDGSFWPLSEKSRVNLAGSCPTAWALDGNAGTSASAHFVGTTDNVPLVLRSGNGRVGINTTGPQAGLHVRNEHLPHTLLEGTGINQRVDITHPVIPGVTGGSASVRFLHGATVTGALTANVGTIDQSAFRIDSRNQIELRTGASPTRRLSVRDNGFVGINTGVGAFDQAAARLHVRETEGAVARFEATTGAAQVLIRSPAPTPPAVRRDSLLFQSGDAVTSRIVSASDGRLELIGEGDIELFSARRSNDAGIWIHRNGVAINHGPVGRPPLNVIQGFHVNDAGSFAGDLTLYEGLELRNIPLGVGLALCLTPQSWVVRCVSSARYKTDIDDLRLGLDAVAALRPVSYAWKHSGELDVGFIAEEVAELDERLIVRDKAGQVDGIRQDRLTAVLTGAVQELLERFQDGEALVAEQGRQLERQRADIDDLRARDDLREAELLLLREELVGLRALLADREGR